MRHLPAMLMMVLLGGGVLAVGGARAQPWSPEDRAAQRATTGGDLETLVPPRGRQVDDERDPGRGPGLHEPVFLEPAATTTEHARLGLSSWTASGAPFDHRENPGGVAMGFSIAWPAPWKDLPSSGPSAWRGSAAR